MRSTKYVNESKQIFSNNLTKCLEANGKKQSNLAKAVEVSTGTVNDWIKCRAYPRPDNIRAIAEYFNIPTADLTEEQWVLKGNSEQEQMVIDWFNGLSDDKKNHLIGFISASSNENN